MLLLLASGHLVYDKQISSTYRRGIEVHQRNVHMGTFKCFTYKSERYRNVVSNEKLQHLNIFNVLIKNKISFGETVDYDVYARFVGDPTVGDIVIDVVQKQGKKNCLFMYYKP